MELDMEVENMIWFIGFLIIIQESKLIHTILYQVLRKIQMLYCNTIDVSERIDVNKIGESKECNIFYYWYFLKKRAMKAMIY